MLAFNWGRGKDIKYIYIRLDMLEKRVDDMFSKVYGLYRDDKHGTLRPKVDILDDDVFRDIRSVGDDIFDLQEKMEKLEKKE